MMDEGLIVTALMIVLTLVGDIWVRQRKMYQKIKLIEMSLQKLHSFVANKDRTIIGTDDSVQVD